MNYALREALRLVAEEGLEVRFNRHRQNAEMLWDGLESLNLPLLVPEENRLVTLSTPQISSSIDDSVVRRRLREDFNIEIAGGFGPLASKVWRIGLMGFSSRKENVLLLLSALEEILG
jgi:alanine-glyoxylate transaminase/serine-glyoxylate transaminase/serine-pyruvate transaminase